MSRADMAAWQRLATELIARRTALKPDWHNRQAFSDAVGVHYRTIFDLENGKRTNFAASTLLAVEHAYRWKPGSIAAILDGGAPVPVTELAPSQADARLTEDEFKAIIDRGDTPPTPPGGFTAGEAGDGERDIWFGVRSYTWWEKWRIIEMIRQLTEEATSRSEALAKYLDEETPG